MTLKDLRSDVATALEAAGITASPIIPERVAPPLAIISAGDPYLEEEGTFNQFLVRLEVTLVAKTATNAVATDALDDLIQGAITALGGWTVSVGQPFMLSVNNATYLASKFTITTTTTLEV